MPNEKENFAKRSTTKFLETSTFQVCKRIFPIDTHFLVYTNWSWLPSRDDQRKIVTFHINLPLKNETGKNGKFTGNLSNISSVFCQISGNIKILWVL